MTNEQEWRKLLLGKIDRIDEKVDGINKEMTTLKVKVAIFSSAISSIATLILNKFLNH